MKQFPKVFYTLTRLIFTPIGFVLGLYFFHYLRYNIPPTAAFFGAFTTELNLLFYFGSGLICAIIGFFLGPLLCAGIYRLNAQITASLKTYGSKDVICASIGLIAGLIVAWLISHIYETFESPTIRLLANLATYLLFGILGILLGARFLKNVLDVKDVSEQQNEILLDASSLIDGRIVEVAKTGFLTDTLVVPSFVLEELRHIADTEDPLKRSKGRKGLDAVRQLQETAAVKVRIDETPQASEKKDEALLQLAKTRKARILTVDFNLNKVANVKHIKVLNLNDLNNAIKPVLIPGEKMKISILKAGKEAGQGVGYLPDGTMIVVENGKEYVGEEKEVNVTTSLQTSAGRIIFARVEEDS